MTRHTLKTTLVLQRPHGAEYEIAVAVEYEHTDGYPDTREEPGQGATVEIIAVVPTLDGIVRPDAGAFLGTLLENDEDLIAECFQDAADEHERGLEYRAEQRAEMLREERL